MSNTIEDYWLECVDEALDHAGMPHTQAQLETIADCVQGAHQMYGECHGHHFIPNPLHDEVKKLKQELRDEQEKVHCKACGGSGSITTYGGTLQFTSQCFACNGDGKVAPGHRYA